MRRRAEKPWPATAPRPDSAGREASTSGPEQHLLQLSETGYATSADIAPDWISSTVVAMSTSR